MKYYETTFEEYINSVNLYNIHPELTELYEKMPSDIIKMGNLIIYGGSGVGKYSQMLKLIQPYSQSMLKYDKKIKIQTDKQSYTYRMSDIHYEIDMSLLGCNSKNLWHDIFLQIIDIISVKNDKKGIIICKNFHTIHTELLEIFYSYMQQYNDVYSNIQIRYIIISEHVSFLPNNILDCCKIISIIRPEKDKYLKIAKYFNGKQKNFIEIATNQNKSDNIASHSITNKIDKILEEIETENIINAKELKSISLINNKDEIPIDIFNTICNNIINEMENYQEIVFTNFRDVIYDTLIYNLDIYDCVWYILVYFIKKNCLTDDKITDILKKTHTFFKYYNNNYRPIYHLESMFFYITIKIHNIKE